MIDNIWKWINKIISDNDVVSFNFSRKEVSLHNKINNAWIIIDGDIYSIQQGDQFRLNLFSNFYGKDISNILNSNKELKRKIMDIMKDRKIGSVTD